MKHPVGVTLMLKSVLVGEGKEHKEFAKKECLAKMVRTSWVISFPSLYGLFFAAWLAGGGWFKG